MDKKKYASNSITLLEFIQLVILQWIQLQGD